MSNIINSEQLKELMTDTTSNKVRLVDFYADWCGPCRMMEPTLEKLDAAYSDNDSVEIMKINVDTMDGNLAQAFGIRSIPNLVILKNGESVNSLIGVNSFDNLKQAIDEQLS